MRCAVIPTGGAIRPVHNTSYFLLAQEAKLVLVLIPGICLQLRINTSTLRVRSQRTTKEKNVGFGAAVW
jgi:hypothetical protein